MDYQILAGPSFIAIYTIVGIILGVAADRYNRWADQILITRVESSLHLTFFFLSFQSEAADDLHCDIQHRDRFERVCAEVLATRYFANDPGGGVSHGNKDVSASGHSVICKRMKRVTIDRAATCVTVKFERILQGGGMQSSGNWSSVRLVCGRAAGPRHGHFQLGHLRRLWHRLSDRPLCYRTECLGSGEPIPY